MRLVSGRLEICSRIRLICQRERERGRAREDNTLLHKDKVVVFLVSTCILLLADTLPNEYMFIQLHTRRVQSADFAQHVLVSFWYV